MITLREITDSALDRKNIVAWRNDPANARWFPQQAPWTLSGHTSWYYKHYLADPSQNLYFVLLNNRPIGTVGMTVRDGCGELERMMLGDRSLARGGNMRKGMCALMDAYGLSHYWLRVMPDNEATIRFHKRNGFTVFSHKGGEYVNTLGERGQYVIMTRSGDGYWPEVPVK